MTIHRSFLALLALPLLPVVLLGSSAAVAGTRVAPAAGAPPAEHRVVHDDLAGDVLGFDVATEAVSAVDDPGTDVTRTVVDHRSRRLVVQVRLADLARDHYRLLLVEIGTPGRGFGADLDYSARRPSAGTPRIHVWQGPRRVDCPGASWGVEQATDSVRLSIPRSCLDDPAWVKVGVGTAGAFDGLAESRFDDSRVDGLADADSERLARGPRQPRA